MKKLRNSLILSAILCSVFALGASLSHKSYTPVKAEQVTPYPKNGYSGTVLFVNGAGTYFKDKEADLAIYCWNNSGSAWSDKVKYRVSGDLLRVMLPYKDGVSQTWSKYIVCRYDPNKNPATDGFGGVYNQTEDIQFSSMLYAHNVVQITGYNGDGKLNYSFNTSNYYGIRCENHIYLDLSGFTDWEKDEAKFAIYFAYPSSSNEDRWSQSYASGSYQPSFLWKVEGQNNSHLYEGIVPSVADKDGRIWNMVIAVRFPKEATAPSWQNIIWDQTQDLKFNSNNSNANMIRIAGWGNGYLDAENIISRQSRVNFYGQYFLDTVKCSGHGDSDSTTSDMWNTVKNAYGHLSREFQGDVWKTDGNKEGTVIEQAMARYDYIVLFKQYDHEDFINRKESPNKTEYQSLYVPNTFETNNDMNIFIIVIASVSVISVASLIIIKRRRLHK